MIDVKRTSIIIKPYNEDTRSEELEKMLSVWDKVRYTFIPIGLYYDRNSETLRIPRGISIRRLKNTFENDKINISKDYDDFSKTIIKLTTNPLNEKQKECIQFLLAKDKYKDLSVYSRFLLEADTGVGKTYCAIATIAYSKKKSAIILNKTGLINQWKDRFLQFTNLDESEICILKGSKTIENLLKGKYDKHKLFLISSKTINSYASQHGWESISEVFKKMKIGIKIFDEAHLDFANLIKIDLFTNTKKTIYLTATAQRSEYQEDRVYKNVFSNVPVLKLLRTKEEAYVKSILVSYKSNPSNMTISTLKSQYGLNTNKYIDYCFKYGGKEKFFNTINIIFNTINNLKEKGSDGKIAILVAKRYAAKDMKEYLSNEYDISSKDIGIYTSDIPKDKKDKQLKKKIIITTYKSFGTGMDIKDLRFLVNCEPYSSKVILRQMIGRLRDIGGDVYYFEIIDEGIEARMNQYSKIEKEMLKISESVKKFQIP